MCDERNSPWAARWNCRFVLCFLGRIAGTNEGGNLPLESGFAMFTTNKLLTQRDGARVLFAGTRALCLCGFLEISLPGVGGVSLENVETMSGNTIRSTLG